ncbi:MAG: DUF881 domain-containing protein [Chloroflexota bacterium]|nr:DUF881 domain-containing protein [Chloroflexota bacterium]
MIFLLPAFLLGVVATAQVQTQNRRQFVPSPYTSLDSVKLTEVALELQREQNNLKRELTALRARLEEIQAQSATVGGRAATLHADLEQLREVAGLTPVTGAGVLMTLDDAHIPPTRSVQSIVPAIVHSEDIVDAINAAWKAGARAIAVNDERVTGASACVGATIQINGTLMSPPFPDRDRRTERGSLPRADRSARARGPARAPADLRARLPGDASRRPADSGVQRTSRHPLRNRALVRVLLLAGNTQR